MTITRTWSVAAASAAIGLIALNLSSFAQPSSFTFAAAGDFDSGGNFKKTVDAVRSDNPDFLLMLGDLSYDNDETAWCDYWKTTGKYDKLLLLSGNHDSGESPGGDINKYVAACPMAKVEIKGRYGKQYFFDYPATAPLARFVMTVPGLGGKLLDLDTRYDKNRQGYTFTEEAIKDARTRGIKWIIVAMHKNYISAMEKDNEISTDNDRSFLSMLLTQKVDVILQGHEHGYERSKQLTTNAATCPVLQTDTFSKACVADDDNNLVKGAGTVIHVLGTGGKGLRQVWTDDSEYPYFAQSDVTTWGFGKFTVTSTALSFTFRRSTGGNLTDAFTIVEAH
jgi:3',5'-cyclic AMP phosphodiesterase CpdA